MQFISLVVVCAGMS